MTPDAGRPRGGTGAGHQDRWAAIQAASSYAVAERLVRTSTISELLDALTPAGWTRYGSRCPACQHASAEPQSAVTWVCLGAWNDMVPPNPRNVIRRVHVGCGRQTVFLLRRLVLEDADALGRLLEAKEAA